MNLKTCEKCIWGVGNHCYAFDCTKEEGLKMHKTNTHKEVISDTFIPEIYAVISQWMDCDGDWIDRRVERLFKNKESAQTYQEKYVRHGYVKKMKVY